MADFEKHYGLNESEVDTNINERVRYTAITGIGLLTTGNPNLDGAGSVVDLLTSASGNGTLIKSITVKAIQSTSTTGMIRLFVKDGLTYFLIQELIVPIITFDAINESFSKSYDLDFYIGSGQTLAGATENSDSFSVIVEGLDISYP